ncbi:P-type cation-transporting ATPase [Neisseria gonorrhoeae]|uniref:P-type cation-transporting ATPase n=1 Tax=Neisseria gonorrhoeae TaxID=485 RepID=A0A378VX69_NEIGO|nr:P-type cation-transporting ATPase [Neisseria gonorrhoeae]
MPPHQTQTKPKCHEKTCFHCGLDVPENLHLTVRYEGEDRETCCVGCQAVAQSIIDSGLGSYYKRRTADAKKPNCRPKKSSTKSACTTCPKSNPTLWKPIMARTKQC